MTAAPAKGWCPWCRRARELCPDGRTLARHQPDQHPAFAARCKGSRKPADQTAVWADNPKTHGKET